MKGKVWFLLGLLAALLATLAGADDGSRHAADRAAGTFAAAAGDPGVSAGLGGCYPSPPDELTS